MDSPKNDQGFGTARPESGAKSNPTSVGRLEEGHEQEMCRKNVKILSQDMPKLNDLPEKIECCDEI